MRGNIAKKRRPTREMKSYVYTLWFDDCCDISDPTFFLQGKFVRSSMMVVKTPSSRSEVEQSSERDRGHGLQ